MGSYQTLPRLSGAVVCENKLSSEIGTRILEAGGNAADAIVATVIAVNTTCGYHSDLGGGGFGIIRCPSGEMQGLNFRHPAPVSDTLIILSDASDYRKLPQPNFTRQHRQLSGVLLWVCRVK